MDNFNKLTQMAVNKHISKYNLFILVLYRRYINYVSVCRPTFWHLPTQIVYFTAKKQNKTKKESYQPSYEVRKILKGKQTETK